jgi:hypothetical protein
MRHEILHDKAAEVFGRVRKSNLKYVSEKLARDAAAPLAFIAIVNMKKST